MNTCSREPHPSTVKLSHDPWELGMVRKIAPVSEAMHDTCGLRGGGRKQSGHVLSPVTSKSQRMKCLIQFAQVHEQFRLPELRSIAELHGIQLNLPDDIDVSRPFVEIELKEEEARRLASRCILIK
jgi:hypothetical protein